MSRGRKWSEAEIAMLARLYPDHAARDVARLLGTGRSAGAVFAAANKMGLGKSPEYRARLMAEASARIAGAGKGTRFARGNTAWNAGKNYDPGGRSAATRFKPGERRGAAARNWKPLGTERVVDGYLQRKVTDTGYAPRDFVPVHHLVWTEAGREIPPGHALRFINGDRTDIRLDNLELISRGNLMRRNSYHNYGPEIARTVQLRGALSRQINRRLREAGKEGA